MAISGAEHLVLGINIKEEKSTLEECPIEFKQEFLLVIWDRWVSQSPKLVDENVDYLWRESGRSLLSCFGT